MGSTGDQKQTPSELFEAQAHIYSHVSSYINSMALRSAVELGIPDVIHAHGKPITLSDLVAALAVGESKTDSVYRLMRLLVHSRFFSEQGSDHAAAYGLTPSSTLLLKDHPNSLSSVVRLIPRPEFVTPCYVMADWIKDDGKQPTAFEKAYAGTTFWEYGARNPDFNALFNAAMANDSGMVKNLVAGECGKAFRGIKSLVDVGGGNGKVAGIISETFPGIKCKVLDLPQVVGDLAGTVSGNVEFVPGDMFQHVPSAQAVMLKTVLHDWSDEECVKILKKCKEAIPTSEEGGKVIIIDIVVNDKNDGDEQAGMKLRFDMLMLLLCNGKERSEEEWERLFMASGFKHYKITPLYGFSSLIEVFP